jgi:hypothetical protein
MSLAMDYFPPNGTRWRWSEKNLISSPWYCNLVMQWAGDEWPLWRPLWSPMSVSLSVDLLDAEYVWEVKATDWVYKRSSIRGKAATSLQACLDAEDVGERALREMTPEWVRKAVAAGWRPPLNGEKP